MSDLPTRSDKICPQCQRTLPLTEFYRNSRRVDGRAYYCKACATARSEASRRKRGIAPARRPATPVGQGLKWCPDCEQIKPLGDFPSTTRKAGGRHSYCKPCHNARGKGTAQRLYGGTREYHLRRRYGIGQREFDELLAEQGGVCAVCGDPDPEHVDHDHRTGWVRGILCFNCNGGLGQFRDSPTRLARAITYLRGTTWQRVLIHPGVFQMCSPTRGRPPSRHS
ncbi:endonuclease VII domain-containing protein [Micromonospora andamanensis]|uniref:endonuclease VII domain-containing protein n=1 Tax=Micromonospora andamanensis TaxID=1287068 RepID=UPI00195092E5|nr:endonuclease VII domain-containing protein [Micromonospora andamanensis]GIJ41356.1 recombination endonuclease VII [Micromonospora andamanensis]